MYKVGKRIPLEMVDHLIITEEGYTPFGDESIMIQLKTSGLFEIVGPEKKALQKWKIETETKRARKEERIVVAKRMKKKGYDTATIKELTGLSVTAIGKL